MRLLLAASAIFLLVGCEVYAVPEPIACPGDRQGTFDFAAVQQTPSPTDCRRAARAPRPVSSKMRGAK